MEDLTSAKVYRSGRTARSWNYESKAVKIEGARNVLGFYLSLSSKGGGITEVKIEIGPDDFAFIVGALVSADRRRAIRELAAALASETAKQAEYDSKIVREARESVYQAADEALAEAPSGRNHAERLTRDMVRQLIDKLNMTGPKRV